MNMIKKLESSFFVFAFLVLFSNTTLAAKRVYDLEIKKETVNKTGENVGFALTLVPFSHKSSGTTRSLRCYCH